MIDVTNLEQRQAAQLASRYLARGYVNAADKDAQRRRPDLLPGLIRAELQVRFPHFSDSEMDGSIAWANGAVSFRDAWRQALKQAAFQATGSVDTRYWDMTLDQRADYLHLLDQIDIYQLQRDSGIPVDAILGCAPDDPSCGDTP